VIRTLGKTMKLKPGEPLSKHDFLLPLSDVMLDLVEKDTQGPSALLYSQLGCSLAHDFLNLATLAGELLWRVGVAPIRTGTPDSLIIAALAESYLMTLRSACDVVAAIIHACCIPAKEKGKVPKKVDSFNSLITWAEKNPARVPENIRFITEHMDWFAELKGIRDKLVHNRYDINVFTDDVAPSFSLMSAGEINLHFLRAPGTRLANPLHPVALLPFLKRVTIGVLLLADQVAQAIARHNSHEPSKTHVLNGVYVPALTHLLSYEEPNREDMTSAEKLRRKLTARYLLGAGDYLKSIDFDYPDGFWLRCAVRLAELFGQVPQYSNPRHPTYRDGEALIEWRLTFKSAENTYIVLLRDGRYLNAETLESDETTMQQLGNDSGAAAAILVANSTPALREIPAEKFFDGLIVDSDPVKAAERVFSKLGCKAQQTEDDDAK
jgi:hypothetical protein